MMFGAYVNGLCVGLLLGFSIGFGVARLLGWWQHRRFLNSVLKSYNLHTFDYAPGPSCPTAYPGPEVVKPVPYPQCSYEGCKDSTGSSWDDRCWSHSLHKDGGRP